MYSVDYSNQKFTSDTPGFDITIYYDTSTGVSATSGITVGNSTNTSNTYTGITTNTSLKPASNDYRNGTSTTSDDGLYGLRYRFTPNVDGTIYVYNKQGGNKLIYLKNNTDSTSSTSQGNTGSSENIETPLIYEYSDGTKKLIGAFDVKAYNDYTVYMNQGTGNECRGFGFVAAATTPSIALDQSSLELSAGGSAVLNATTSYFTDDKVNISWSVDDSTKGISVTADTDDSTKATVSVEDGTAVNTTATITATATGVSNPSETDSATCTVTVADPEVTAVMTCPVTQITLSQDGEVKYTFDSSELENNSKELVKNVKAGTYEVAYTNAAPVTYDVSLPTTLTVSGETTITPTVTQNNVDSNNFSNDVYEEMSGHTVKYGAYTDSSNKAAWYPSSFGYLNAIQQKNTVPIAGALDNSTEDSKVYMTVSGGKINTVGRSGNFQFNADTVLTIPVTPQSKVEIVNYSNTETEVHNNVYTIGSNEETPEQVGLLSTDDGGFKSIYDYEYTYTGTENGYVKITGLSGGYLSSITVTTPQWTGVVKGEDMDFTNTNSISRKGKIVVNDLNDNYTKEYSDIFGENLSNAGGYRYGYISGNETASKSYTLVNDGYYRIYVLAETPSTNNTITLTDSSENKVVDSATLTNSVTIGTNGEENHEKDFVIYTYDKYLDADTYTFTYFSANDSTNNNFTSDIIAMCIAPAINFGAQAYDSGYYTNSNDEKVGVIRYLQEYGTADGVTEYGFFFVDENADITDYKISKPTTDQPLENGFYGDLYGIPSTKFENDYLAKPYVTINGTTMYADTITGSVGTDAKEVTYSSTETETAE